MIEYMAQATQFHSNVKGQQIIKRARKNGWSLASERRQKVAVTQAADSRQLLQSRTEAEEKTKVFCTNCAVFKER